MSNGIHLAKGKKIIYKISDDQISFYLAGSEHPTVQDDGKLLLYSMRFCPFAQRAHLVLEAKKVPYRTIFINLSEKPEWFPTKSPLGKVPALQISAAENPLIESLLVCDYLDEQYPENPLYPKDPLQKCKDRILVELFNGVLTPFYKLSFTDEPTDPKVFENFFEKLESFENELNKRGTKFFGGESPAMVDYMIWPWLERVSFFPLMVGYNGELNKNRFGKIVWNIKEEIEWILIIYLFF
jgi:pyrimidodiazepine synthase